MEEELANKCADENYEKIKDEVEGIKYDEGGFNSGKLWKLRKKLFPHSRDPPTAMLDQAGNLITDPIQIQNLALETYKKRLENRTMKEKFSDIQKEKEQLCAKRLEAAKDNKTEPWSMNDLEAVLNHLKKNKSRDPFGYANEIFKSDVAGDDLKRALLNLMNKIKETQVFPEALEICNISSIWKKKKSRNDFENYRGIFRVNIFRSILDRLIYNDEYDTVESSLTDSNVGARQGRNIRDNIFVMNAITNSVIKEKREPIDIQIFDVEKCFDALWLQECINDLYETGLGNDKLPILFNENQNAKVAVKTQQGITNRVNIKNIVMQGSVWGSLFCTTTMEKLGKLCYKNKELLYKYKNVVEVPPLCMVDDILSIQKCTDAKKMNATINTFIEMKKLKLSHKKCNRIHLGRSEEPCQELRIHEQEMMNSEKEKYLGDYIDKSGKVKSTLEDRISKGWGILSEIKAILNEVPLGKYKIEIGLLLRQAMLVNGLLYNSEAWHSVSNSDLVPLEKIDENLLRFVLGAHAKAPLETLYLESGAIPIRYIVASRRMCYLQTIVKRDDTELTKRVFNAQLEYSCHGDYVQLVKSDFEEMNIPFNVENVKNTEVKTYKKLIKNKVKEAALKYLQQKQKMHSKVKNIEYKNLETQKYLTSPIFTNMETSLLYGLRTRTARTFRANFSNLYGGKVECPMKCWDVNQNEPAPADTQEHLLICKKMKIITNNIASGKIEYNHLFSDTNKQREVLTLYNLMIEYREQCILKEQEDPPGGKPDPSSCNNNCCSSTIFTHDVCTDGTIIGNK